MVRAKLILVLTCIVTVLLCVQVVPAQPGGGSAPAKPGAGKPGEKKPDGKPEDDGKKKEGDESSDSIKRPAKPPRVPDPREFDVAPDEHGLIRFNLYGQAWPDILQWLARVSNFSLDWQELPQDYVNLTTTRSYSVPEARDLFNRLLLDRGYTMVEQGRVLSVVKISKLDPSLLRRVEDESELLDLPAHDFVKITFKLPDKLTADKAAEDVKSLLSPNAKVQPLLATNRLLVIDAVVNLREVSRLINSEHAAAAGHTVPKEFVIRFARADHVADQVMILLGLDPSSRRTPQELQLETQRLQLFQQMHQKGKDVTKYLRQGDSPQVFLAVNDRNNSILVNAPPAEMRIIERSVLQLDVPSGSAAGELSGLLSMVKYQLVTISPQSIVTALEQIGDLDPRSRLRMDSDAKAVFAHATAGDHEKIQAMVDSLDGTGRELEVIWLRRLPADAVAATLERLLAGKKEEKEDSGRRSIFYYPSYGSRGQEKPEVGFRVDADVEKNRLLLYVNEAELAQVHKFLEKLGEIPGRSGNPHTVRFLESRSNEDILRTLDQLRRAWNGPNELLIEAPEIEQEPATDEDAPAESPPPQETEAGKPKADHAVYRVVSRTPEPPATSHQLDLAAAPPATADVVEPRKRSPDDPSPSDDQPRKASIRITVTPDGRIVLNSDDAAALDEIEDLISSLTPPAPDFKVYYLKHAMASMVTLNLEEYFAEEGEFDTDENWMRAWYGLDFEKSGESGTGLSARRKIRFIYDYDTNSILVANGSPAQLGVVETLIELYDMPPSEDSISARSFQMFKLKYSRAEAVAKTIKEVFRDLLSSKDKDFEARGEKQEGSQTRNFYRIGGTGDDDKATRVKASFDGALSVGVDELSNSVIVSAQEEWMPSIAQMIEYLDDNARDDTTVSVYQIQGAIKATAVQAALADILGDAWVGNRPPGASQQQQPGKQQPPQTANQTPRRGDNTQNPN